MIKRKRLEKFEPFSFYGNRLEMATYGRDNARLIPLTTNGSITFYPSRLGWTLSLP